MCSMVGHEDGYGITPEDAYDSWRDIWCYDKHPYPHSHFSKLLNPEGGLGGRHRYTVTDEEYRSARNKTKDKPESSRTPQTGSVVAVIGVDLGSSDQPDYSNVNYPKDSWLNVGIPNLVKKIKNWRGGEDGK